MKKIIDYGKVWTCENMDNLAPIKFYLVMAQLKL